MGYHTIKLSIDKKQYRIYLTEEYKRTIFCITEIEELQIDDDYIITKEKKLYFGDDWLEAVYFINQLIGEKINGDI